MKKTKLPEMTKHEIESGFDRIRHAEGLIVHLLQITPNHEGAKTWLVNYGTFLHAAQLRHQRGLSFDEATQAAYKKEEPHRICINGSYFEVPEGFELAVDFNVQHLKGGMELYNALYDGLFGKLASIDVFESGHHD